MKKSIVVIILVLTLVFSSIWVGFSKKEPFKDDIIKNDKQNILYEENKEQVSNEANTDEESITRFDSNNGIDMAVIFNNILEQDDEHIVFKVMVNNHRINLENIKYAELAKLKLSDGSIIDKGFQWESRGGGHHIFGYLKLPNIYNENNIINQNIDSIQLEFQGVGDAERLSFKWEKEVLDMYTYGSKKNDYLAYVPNAGDGSISILDVSKNKLIDEIKIGDTVSHGIAISSDGKKLYTGNLENGEVFILDIKSKELIDTIDTGRNLHGIDITPDGRYLFTTSGDLQEGEEFNYINVIDTTDDKIIKIIESNGKSPSHIDFTKDSKLAFVNNVMSGNITVVDVEKLEIISTIDVGKMPNESELSPDDKYLYVANVQDGTISIVDVNEGKEIDKIKTGEGTHGVAVSKDGKYVWTTNRFSKDISVFDIEKKQVIKTIKINGEPNHISILPDSDIVYVSNLQSEDISVMDMKSYKIIKTINIGKEPHEIVFVKNN